MPRSEPRIRIGDREELILMLSEAAAIEHNVMCCYLYAIWSLKSGEVDGLTRDQAVLVRRWKTLLTEVSIEEMEHLVLVCNLMSAIGGTPYLSRPNFPIPRGFHPADIDLELVGFSRELINHAVYLERPEGIDLSDAPEFLHPDSYERAAPRHTIMPATQDYRTIGHLYRGIYHGFEVLARRYGEHNLFCGDVNDQVNSSESGFAGLRPITDLASARIAIDTIVEQGEGAPGHSENSHYQKFLKVREDLETALDLDPDFAPAFPVARNPVPRRPLEGTNRAWVTHPEAVRVLDLANSLYAMLLRLMSQAYGRGSGEAGNKAIFVELARRLMSVLSPVCEYLASLPCGPEHPGLNAGMSFTMLRDTARLPAGPGETMFLHERMQEIANHAAHMFPEGHRLAAVSDAVRDMARKLETPKTSNIATGLPPVMPPDQLGPSTGQGGLAGSAISRVEGKDLVLTFDSSRCYHSRHCVLEASSVFLANVEGDWLFPDAMETSDLRGVCHNCPSGAITYEPKGNTPPEPIPAVNTLKVRENGPYAIRAQVSVGGRPEGYRVSLCRCGASKNKPFCDGSHNQIGFHATGEPDTLVSEPLAARGGELTVEPQIDGPLIVTGNLEICSNTGRTINRVSSVRLCRCGGSKNKPFCDNTHRKIGFKSENLP